MHSVSAQATAFRVGDTPQAGGAVNDFAGRDRPVELSATWLWTTSV